jgi:uncharacterized coiled-coil protein SlyX
MKMKTLRLGLAAAALAGLSTAALAEDLTVVYKTTSPSGSGTTTSYHSATRMRMGDNDTETIIEYGTGRLVTIDHVRKQYSEITLAEMEAALARMQQATAQMQQQLAALPPAMRERMAQMMGGGSGAVTLTKGGVRKVAGYDCQEWVIAAGTGYSQRVCASTAVVPPAVSVDYRKFASLAGSAGAMANNPMFKTFAKAAEELKKIQGFHLADSVTASVMGKSFDTSKEATEVKKGPIPASAFDLATIARGYKKVAHPMTTMK